MANWNLIASGRKAQVLEQLKLSVGPDDAEPAAKDEKRKPGPAATQYDLARKLVMAELDAAPASGAGNKDRIFVVRAVGGVDDAGNRTININIDSLTEP